MSKALLLTSAFLLLCVPLGMAQDAPARKKKGGNRHFAALLPHDTVLTVSASGLRQLRAKLKRLENAIPWLLRNVGESGPPLRRRLGQFLRGKELPPGVDDRRPIGFAVDLTGGRHVFVPLKDVGAFKAALKSWIDDAAVHTTAGYAVVTRRGEYKPPARAVPGPAARGDVVLSLRPGALLEKYRPLVEAGIASMEEAVTSDPDVARLVPYLKTELAVLLRVVESTDQFDIGVSLSGEALSLEFYLRPTKKGLVGDMIAAMKKHKTKSPALGGLLPAGGLFEVEAQVPPAVIHPILDAVPWKELWPEETEARKKLWSDFIDLSLRHLDGRFAASYSFRPADMSFEIYEAVGVTDGDAYRKFFREMPQTPAFKDMLKAMREFLPEFQFEIRPEAFQIADVPVDFFREELNPFPGLPPGGDLGVGKVMKFEGYVAVLDDTALFAVGTKAKKMIERMIYLKKAGGVFENLLTSAKPTRGFARARLDVGALVGIIKLFVPGGVPGRLARLETDKGGLTVNVEKTLRGNAVVARVDVPLMRILRAVVPTEKAPPKKAKKARKKKKGSF